jgi:hypothetical protein
LAYVSRMDIIDDKDFLHLISPQLERFTKQSNDVWKCRCPFCGDSQKNKFKTRCYIYKKGDGLLFHCHNCQESGRLYKLVKHVNPALAREYSKAAFLNKDKKPEFKYEMNSFTLPIVMDMEIKLPKLSSLIETHPARKYMAWRKIPMQFLQDLYYTDDFKQFVLSILPDTDKEMKDGEPRIVIPLRNKDGVLVGVQGNTLYSEGMAKYMTIRLREEQLTWGMDTYDPTQVALIVEGAYDAMFLPNSIAALTSALYKVDIDNSILVFDNEPRSQEICSIMEKAINKGRAVFFWPENIVEKDINSYVQNGHDLKVLIDNIHDLSYRGLRAKLEMDKWRKI